MIRGSRKDRFARQRRPHDIVTEDVRHPDDVRSGFDLSCVQLVKLGKIFENALKLLSKPGALSFGKLQPGQTCDVVDGISINFHGLTTFE